MSAASQTTTVDTAHSGTSDAWRESRAVQFWLPRILGYAVVLGLWQLSSTYLVERAFSLPSPITILQEMSPSSSAC